MQPRPPVLVIAALLLAACSTEDAGRPAPTPSRTDLPFAVEAEVTIDPSEGDPLTLHVAVADTDEERTRGLMDVEEMPDDVGMVFLHEEATESDFWMKDTLIPLTVAVWDESMTIRQIVDMQPCEEDPCRIYDITVPWTGALEVNRGILDRAGVAVGDGIRLQD